MGSKLIWIAVALLYGAACAAIYVFLLWRKHRRQLLRRGIIACFIYSGFGLAIVWLLVQVFGE